MPAKPIHISSFLTQTLHSEASSLGILTKKRLSSLTQFFSTSTPFPSPSPASSPLPPRPPMFHKMFEAPFFKAPGSGMIPLHLPDLSDPYGEQCWGWEEWNTGELVPGFASCVLYLCMIQVDYYFVCPNGNDCLNLNNYFN